MDTQCSDCASNAVTGSFAEQFVQCVFCYVSCVGQQLQICMQAAVMGTTAWHVASSAGRQLDVRVCSAVHVCAYPYVYADKTDSLAHPHAFITF